MLKGKTAVITGGSRGIGEAIAYKLASMGANIAVIYAGNTEAAENVCSKCEQEYGVDAKAYQCDVSDFTAVKEIVAKIKTDFGTAHILVNNAGITRDGLLAMMKEEDYDAVMDTNLKGSAIECRINAGSCGTLEMLHVPGGPSVRFDTCLVVGTTVSPYYDSLLGKLIVFAKTREETLRKMRAALCELVIDGIPTNIEEQKKYLSTLLKLHDRRSVI